MSSPTVSDSLAGKVALITGAGSGLGEQFAHTLTQDGALVVVNDVNQESAQRVASQVDGATSVFDVTDSQAFEKAVNEVVQQHGRIDILVNNAGIIPANSGKKFDDVVGNEMHRMAGDIASMRPLNILTDLSDDEWDRMIKVHLYGAFYGCRSALKHMQNQRSGSIVNVSSVLGLYPSATAPDYSVAKAGIIALTKSVAYEVAHLGIRVNAICPGYVNTPLLTPLSENIKAAITTQIPVGRMASASELANLLRFVVSPEASYCTGEVFSMSGGYHG